MRCGWQSPLPLAQGPPLPAPHGYGNYPPQRGPDPRSSGPNAFFTSPALIATPPTSGYKPPPLHSSTSCNEYLASMGTITCQTDNNYDGHLGLRTSAIFVILIGSFLGAWLPVFASRRGSDVTSSWVFRTAKFSASGVILGTAFIHVCRSLHSPFVVRCY